MAVSLGKSRVGPASAFGGNRKFDSSSPFFRGYSAPKYPCHSFNNRGFCTRERCPYIHACQKCGRTHTKKQCNSGKAQTPSKSVDYQTKNHKQVQVFEWKVVLLPKLRQTGWTIGFKGYDGRKRKCLVKGFKVSFRIPFAGQRSCRLSGDATSVTKNLDILNFRLRLTTKELQVLLR